MSGLSYRAAGVDIDKKMTLLEGIGAMVAGTHGPGVLHELGAFGGMFSGRFDDVDDPVLVASNDGVGTKARTATRAGRVRGLGHDIVNHCVNDILVQGARPLFFMDYFAASRLEKDVFQQVVTGLAEACRLAGAALLGGETAEMPGSGEFDLVGFVVGVVDRARVLPQGVQAGDVLVGLRSDGPHTNGYSLINRLIERDGLDLEKDPRDLGESLADALLRPHRSYLAPIHKLREAVEVHALAHITGGGLQDNLPRVLPTGTGAEIDRAAWQPNPVFPWIVETAAMDVEEAWQVFNMGCGLVVALAEADVPAALQTLRDAGEDAWTMGRIVEGEGVRFPDAPSA